MHWWLTSAHLKALSCLMSNVAIDGCNEYLSFLCSHDLACILVHFPWCMAFPLSHLASLMWHASSLHSSFRAMSAWWHGWRRQMMHQDVSIQGIVISIGACPPSNNIYSLNMLKQSYLVPPTIVDIGFWDDIKKVYKQQLIRITNHDHPVHLKKVCNISILLAKDR